MTVTADQQFNAAPAKGIPYVLNGSRFAMRFAFKMGTLTFGLVAVLVWLAPGASWESDIMLFKMAITIVATFCAALMWQSSLPVDAPGVEVDVATGEVRVVRENVTGPERVIERCAFADLHAVDVRGKHITFWGQRERFLAEISLTDAGARKALLAALKSLGKIG